MYGDSICSMVFHDRVEIIIIDTMVANMSIHCSRTWKKFSSASYLSKARAVEVLIVQLGGPCTFGPTGNK